MYLDRHALSDALCTLTRVAPSNGALPILRCVRLDAADAVLTLTATDLDQRLTAELPAETPQHLTACLPAKMLLNVVRPERKADTGTVEIEPVGDNVFSVRVDGVNTKLHGLGPDDFPAVLAPSSLDWSMAAVWPAEQLRESLGFILPAISKDETRPVLNGAYLNGDIIAATDGHRLHRAPLPGTLDEPMVVPRAACETLHRLLADADQVVVARAEEWLKLRVGHWTLETRLIDGEFPDVNQVIPARRGLPLNLTLDTKVFDKALARITKLSCGEKRLKLTVNGSVTLTTWEGSDGEAEIEVAPLASNHAGDEDFVTGFDGSYLRDALKAGNGTVDCGFNEALMPMRMDGEDGKIAVVMPMRV